MSALPCPPRRVVLVLGCVLLATCRQGSTEPDPPTPASVVVVAAGDLVCGAATPATRPCQHEATAAATAAADPDAVLLLGDVQYEDASLAEFRQYFAASWGQFKSITYPAPGNHEYQTTGAAGYFDYFNGEGAASGRAGDRDAGYYTVTLGAWRVIALNSNCAEVGGCATGSTQEQWLRAVLAANDRPCTLAFWHHTPFSSSPRAPSAVMLPIWQALHAAGVDVVLAAHEHHYERFAPMDASGAADSTGVRLFVVGTGGRDLHTFGTAHPASEVREDDTFGVLKLVLRDGSYDWAFIPVEGTDFTDSGSKSCS